MRRVDWGGIGVEQILSKKEEGQAVAVALRSGLGGERDHGGSHSDSSEYSEDPLLRVTALSRLFCRCSAPRLESPRLPRWTRPLGEASVQRSHEDGD